MVGGGRSISGGLPAPKSIGEGSWPLLVRPPSLSLLPTLSPLPSRLAPIDSYNLFDDKLTATNYKELISLSGNITTHGPGHGLKLPAAGACAVPLKNPWAWALLEYAILGTRKTP